MWHCLPPELLRDVGCRVLQQPASSSVLTGPRLACKQWRKSMDSAVKRARAKPDNDYVQYFDKIDLRGLTMQTFTGLRCVDNLPSPCLRNLLATAALVSLSVTGTGTNRDYAALAHMPALRRLHFKGPVSLTSERLCILGAHPKLRYLTFDRILFPRTPYPNAACQTAAFHHLEGLRLMCPNPLLGEGSVSCDSGKAGLQFLCRLKSLKRLTIHEDARSQVLFETLETLPLLQDIFLLGTCFGSCVEWATWAVNSPGKPGVYSNTHK